MAKTKGNGAESHVDSSLTVHNRFFRSHVVTA